MNVLSPSSNKTYAPLSDGAHASTSNGAVVYTRRLSSTQPGSPSASASASTSPASRVGALSRSESEETLAPLPGERGGRGGRGDDDGDLGTVRIRRDKGKAREQGYDVERDAGVGGRAAYPPVNEAEDEERRIQDNLAQLAARDQARRRAARLSRALPASPDPNTLSPVSSGSSSRPVSATGETVNRRTSILGSLSGVLGGGSQKTAWEGELPLTNPSTGTYTNPYDPPAPPTFPAAPRMTVTPPVTSPFLDPDPRASSATVRPDAASLNSPTSPVDGAFTYGGPGWRGGHAAVRASSEQGRGGAGGGQARGAYAEGGGDKWWHAFCAWGDDLDGGHGGDNGDQAGRTNPFE